MFFLFLFVVFGFGILVFVLVFIFWVLGFGSRSLVFSMGNSFGIWYDVWDFAWVSNVSVRSYRAIGVAC